MSHKNPFKNTHWIPINKDQDQVATVIVKDGVVMGLACEVTDDADINAQQINDLLDSTKNELRFNSLKCGRCNSYHRIGQHCSDLGPV